MPPLMFFPGFGFVWRLIMFTPSMIRRFFSGFTLSTRPRLPRSLPVITRTLSFFRIGVAKLDITQLLTAALIDNAEPCFCVVLGSAANLQDLWCQRND